MKNALIWLSLTVLILSSLNVASATYYYTDEYFKETFGNSNLYADEDQLKKDNVMFIFTDLDKIEYDSQPDEIPIVEILPLIPIENTTVVEETLVEDDDIVVVLVADEPENLIEEEIPSILILPVEEDITEANLTEDTINDTNVIENLTEETEETPSLVVDRGDSGVVIVDMAADSSNDSADGDLVFGPAVVAEEEGTPFQIMVIGFLIVVIIVMLVILLTRSEDSEDGEWEEGDFLKSKKATTQSQKKKDILSNIKKEVKKESKPKSTEKPKKKTEVKPFLLKIKDEV